MVDHHLLDNIHVKLSYFIAIFIRYHHVSSVGRNLAVNIWWSASAKPHLPDCNLPNTTLEKCTFFGFETLYPREAIDALK